MPMAPKKKTKKKNPADGIRRRTGTADIAKAVLAAL